MQCAFNLPNFGEFADVRALVEVARAAEEHGWDGVFIWDHLSPVFAPGMLVPVADTTVALTAIALATERIRFGAMVTPLARRRPQKLARELVTLDRLSGGRVVLGVGLGEPSESEFAAFGDEATLAGRARIVAEALRVITQLWDEKPVDHDGEFLHVHTGPLQPGPVQRPRIPIWIAATWPGRPEPLRRAAQWDGVFPIPPDPMRDFITVDDIAPLRAAIGRDDEFDIVVNAGPHGDLAAFARAGVTWWIETYFTVDDALQHAREGPPRLG
jgi:alkanesulfonate monooxygenase SsuD/methylene tetrahydromethanopterin reductase-like flavin-dependent oxidoreductase (luciferase family)